MSTGWRWIRDDGEVYKSQLRALQALQDKPGSRMWFSELTMAGEKRTEVTDEWLAILKQRETS